MESEPDRWTSRLIPEFVRVRGQSMTMVVLVLALVLLLQTAIAYSATYGRLGDMTATIAEQPILGVWVAIRAILIILVFVLWIMNRKLMLFKTIIGSCCFHSELPPFRAMRPGSRDTPTTCL